ncbi:MAG: hypothetical protein AAF849_21175 [Bacteroidota bacterium]
MTYDQLMLLLKSPEERKVNLGLAQLIKKYETKVWSILRNQYACKNKEDFDSCFYDALLTLEDQVKKDNIKEASESKLVSFLINTTRNKWTKYSTNPEKSKLQFSDTIFDFFANKEDTTARTSIATLQLAIQNIIEQLGSPCKELIRYSDYFTPPSESKAQRKKNENKLSHQEIAEELDYGTARDSIRATGRCMDRLKRSVKQALETDPNVQSIINEYLGLS